MLSEAQVIERSVGPPFWKYNVVDMDRGLEVEVGVPVAVVMTSTGRGAVGATPGDLRNRSRCGT